MKGGLTRSRESLTALNSVSTTWTSSWSAERFMSPPNLRCIDFILAAVCDYFRSVVCSGSHQAALVSEGKRLKRECQPSKMNECVEQQVEDRRVMIRRGGATNLLATAAGGGGDAQLGAVQPQSNERLSLPKTATPT